MNNGIDGKVVVITGASSGLGEAAGRHLAALGAKVVLGARRFDRDRRAGGRTDRRRRRRCAGLLRQDRDLAESFARVFAFAMSQPEDVDISEVPFRPTARVL